MHRLPGKAGRLERVFSPGALREEEIPSHDLATIDIKCPARQKSLPGWQLAFFNSTGIGLGCCCAFPALTGYINQFDDG